MEQGAQEEQAITQATSSKQQPQADQAVADQGQARSSYQQLTRINSKQDQELERGISSSIE